MNKERLLKLADFLEFTLEPAKFNFRHIISQFDKEQNCGSVCCAIGWTPVVFPNDVGYSYSQDYGYNGVYLKADPKVYDYRAMRSLFEIGATEASELFSPGYEEDEVCPWNEELLGDDASAKEVADSIRSFVEWKEQWPTDFMA